MGKREKKIELIRKYIHNVSSSSTYAYGSIPSSVASNARISYGGSISNSDILGLVDTSITGSGKTGLIFTEHRVYYNNGMFGSRGYISYRDIMNTGKISGDIFSNDYNRQALIELLSRLAEIEGKDLGGTLEDVNKAIDGISKTMDDVEVLVNKGLDLLGRFLK